MSLPIDSNGSDAPGSSGEADLSNASALGAARYPGLANPIAFHMLRMPCLAGRLLWLFAVYEEDGAEFEAAARLDPGVVVGRMAEVLAGFMTSEQCFDAVVEPLARRVAERLGR